MFEISRCTALGYKDIESRKSEFVAKTHSFVVSIKEKNYSIGQLVFNGGDGE